MRIFLLFLFISLASCRSVSGYGDGDLEDRPTSFARSANLKLLKNSKEDEIRVWVTFLSSVRGTVITKNGTANYNNRNSGRLQLVKGDASAPKTNLMQYLPTLSKLSKATYLCDTGIHGGAFYFIEGIYNGEYFFTMASWPESCTSPEFDALNEFLRAAK